MYSPAVTVTSSFKIDQLTLIFNKGIILPSGKINKSELFIQMAIENRFGKGPGKAAASSALTEGREQ